MSETCTAGVSVAITALITQAAGQGTSNFAANLNAALAALQNGTGAANVCNQIYYSQRSLATSTSETIDLYSPPLGSGTDAFGNALTIAHVKILIIQNLGSGTPVEADVLTIGAGGSTAQCTSILTPNTSGLTLPGLGCVILTTPGAIGYLVGSSTTNHTLKIANGGAGTTSYNIWIIGSTT